MIYIEILIGLIFTGINYIIYRKILAEKKAGIEYHEEGVIIKNKNGEIVFKTDKVL